MRQILKSLLVLVSLIPVAARAEAPLTVFAAASLTNALQDIGVLWAASGHPKPVFSFASSSTLALQIDHGAPANLFLSADETWMDDLAKHGGLAAGTRRDLVGNSLVLVEPAAGMHPLTLKAGTDLGPVLGAHGRLAVGDPAHVPAGIYAKQALQKLGLWPTLQSRLAPADSVRSALRLVELGEAPAGIVYATDVGVSPKLATAGVFPASSHDPILYPVAIVKAGDGKAARDFLAFLGTQPCQDVFMHYHFTHP